MKIESLDIIVAGAGQAGLAMGYYLKQTPFRFNIYERNLRIGDNWRNRYDSLLLFTPRAYSCLPGMKLSGEPDGYPGKDEFAGYLENYASHFELPIRLRAGLSCLEQRNGFFQATTQAGEVLQARAVVLATGSFQKPSIPALSKQLSGEVLQCTASSYKNSQQVPPGSVLVVGDGASGRDIAVDLAGDHTVYLATGFPRRLLPDKVLGKHIFWWFDRLGILRAPENTLIGKYIQKKDPFPGRGKDLKQLRRKGIRIMQSLVAARGRQVTFADGAASEVVAVVWATGYKDDSDWVAIPAAKDAQGRFIHRQGISPVERLYFIGRPWQRSRGSGFIFGVGADAALLTEQIVRDLS